MKRYLMAICWTVTILIAGSLGWLLNGQYEDCESVIVVSNTALTSHEGWIISGNITSTPLDPYESLRKAYAKLWIDYQILAETNARLSEDNLNLRVALSHWDASIWENQNSANLTLIMSD